MAGPITHTLFAEHYLMNHRDDIDEKVFMVGNIFPDIRYLNVIGRDKTHSSAVALDDIKRESDPFRKGMLFHSYIDVKREVFVTEKGAYDTLPDTPLSSVALKVSEDILAYEQSRQWQIYADHLNQVVTQETKFSIPEQKIKEWHTIHQDLFTTTPVYSDRGFFHELGFTGPEVAEIYRLVEHLRENAIVASYFETMVTELTR